MNNFAKIFLLVISVSYAAQGYLVPGPPGGGGQPAPYPGNPGGGHGGGGLVPGPRPPRPPEPPRPPRPPRPPMPPSDPYPGNPYPSDPYPGNPNPGYGSEVKTIWIGRAVYNETLPLRALAGIGRQYDGWEVVSVRANTRPNSPYRTEVSLLSDGRVVASQVNPGYQINLVPQVRTVLDDRSNLKLNIGGETYIEDIMIEIRYNGGGYNPPPTNPGYGQNIDINVYRSVYGNDRIDLTQYIDLSRYRGYTIQSVIVTATSRYNTSFVSLLINGNNMGQIAFNSSYSQQGTIYLNRPAVIGQGADSLVLYTQGDMTIERVTIVVR
ncbi:MAG: hypothetical protein ABL930_12855 [Pseudobdellovibrio sp.]